MPEVILVLLCLAVSVSARVLPTHSTQDIKDLPIYSSLKCSIVRVNKTLVVPGCEEREYQIDICQGYCLSYSFPITPPPAEQIPKHFLALSRCCRATRFQSTELLLPCVNDEFYRERIVHATRCECFDCRD